MSKGKWVEGSLRAVVVAMVILLVAAEYRRPLVAAILLPPAAYGSTRGYHSNARNF